jgi:hypothetical protein
VGSPVVVVGLAMVLALQIAIHLRIADIPRRLAMAKRLSEADAARSTRAGSDVLQEALARRLNLLVRGIEDYHNQIAEDFRVQIAAGEQRARLAEGKREDAAGVATELRALVREMKGIVAELHALQGDFAELVCNAAETQKAAPTPEDADERKTIEVAPVASPTAVPANGGADNEEPDDPEEKTKLFSKDAPEAAVLVALRQRTGAPAVGAPRHALRPPPIADECDDANERPSILPEARIEHGSTTR